jgi:hypothetical protein
MARLTVAAHRVLFVEALGLRRPTTGHRDLPPILGRAVRRIGLPRPSLWAYVPQAEPLIWEARLRQIDEVMALPIA